MPYILSIHFPLIVAKANSIEQVSGAVSQSGLVVLLYANVFIVLG